MFNSVHLLFSSTIRIISPYALHSFSTCSYHIFISWSLCLASYLILSISFFGTGTVVPMLEAVMAVVPVEKLAVHFHDTYGQSLSNILVSLQVSHINMLKICHIRFGVFCLFYVLKDQDKLI